MSDREFKVTVKRYLLDLRIEWKTSVRLNKKIENTKQNQSETKN